MTERVNLVDGNGVPRVFGLRREDAFALDDEVGSLHIPIAVAVIFNGMGEVLVQQRSIRKIVDPGKLDVVCGVVSANEPPRRTALRETWEETGVVPANLHLIAQGVNSYDRYRYLFAGHTSRRGMTVELPNHEVEWAGMKRADTLTDLIDSGDIEPVGDFFEHLALASVHRQALINTERPLLAYASPQEA